MKLLKTCSFLVLTTVIWLPSLSADAAGDGVFEVLVDDVYVTGGVLVDDFNGTTIDFSKWSTPNEYAVKLDTVNDNLVMISAGSSIPIPFNVTQTPVNAPNLASIQATITVVDTASETLYGVDRVTDNLITVDTATGAGTIVGPLGFDGVDGLAFDPTTGILYGIDSVSVQLITIDTATGAGTAVGPIGSPNVQGLAFGAGGILYAVDLSLDLLLTINVSTGAATIVGPLGFTTASSLAYDASSGILYSVDYIQDQLITIDTTTGAGTPVGTAPGTAGPGNVAGLAFSSDGTLYAVDVIFDQLLTIDTTTGTATAIGPVGFDEPSALAFSANRSSANVAGQYYNANSATPADQNGDIIAIVSIGDRGNGNLEAWATFLESIHPFFGTWNTSTYDIITAPGALLPDTPYVARIEYNQGLNQFTFTVDGTSIVQSGPPRMGPANQTKQFLAATTCCDLNASIKATFDDLNLGNILVDDFSTELLDRSIWADYSHAVTLSSRVYPGIIGKLLLFASNQDIPQNGRADAAIRLDEFNPDRIEALVSISSNSLLQPGIRGRIRLNGYAYNEKRDGGVVALPYNGCEDEVWVQVQINLKDGALWATADAGPETVDCDTKTILISETFVKPLAFDTEYLLWIERVGNILTLGLDNESYSHTILTQIYPPSPQTGYRRLNARIQDASTPDDGGGGDDDGGGGGGSLSPWLLLSLILGIWMLRTRISSRYKK